MVTLDQGGAGRPGLRLRPVEGRACRLGELTWVQRTTSPEGSPWRIVPDASPHLIAHRMSDGDTYVLLVGARSRYVDISRGGRAFTVGVRLLPGALPALTGESAWALRDRSAPVSEFVGRRVDRELDRIHDQVDPRAVERALQDLLTALGRDRRPDWRARGFAAVVLEPWSGPAPAGATTGAAARRATGGGPWVREAAEALGVSERALRDACRAQLGLRPKEAQRIVRLHRALALGLAGRPDVVAAVRAGYADQAHLIRECRALLGSTPKAFRARGAAETFKTSPSGPP